MAYYNARPGGFSDEEEDDDLEEFGGGGGVQNVVPVAVAVPLVPAREVNGGAASGGGGGGFGVGRGRGRGRGRPPPREEEEDGWSTNGIQVPQRWINGRGRGRGQRGQQGRRGGGVNGDAVEDRRKQKEELLRKIPGDGDVEWAREMGWTLKRIWEEDQQRKGARDDEKRYPKMLQECFRSCQLEKKGNVPALALYLTLSCVESTFHSGKCQAQAVCEGLAEYFKSFPATTSLSDSTSPVFISVSLQQVAFQTALFSRKDSLQKLLYACYLANSNMPLDNPELLAYLLQELHNLCQKHDYSIAAQCIISLGLHSEVDIHLFLVPLVLQDKLPLVEEFLATSPPHQRQLLLFLDSFFQQERSGVDVYAKLHHYCTTHNIPEVKCEKLQHKPLAKLIKRWRTKYNLGFDCCPNVGHRQRFGELRHLFSRRYDKQEMNSESFAELIEDLSQNDESLWEAIINHYLDYFDYKGCAQFIIQHKLWTHSVCQMGDVLCHLPQPVRQEWENKAKMNMQAEESWEEEDWCTGQPQQTQQQPPRQLPTATAREDNWEFEMDQCSPPQQAPGEKRPKIKEYFRHPFQSTSGNVILYQDPEQVLQLCQSFPREGPILISGFDSEWKPILSRSSGAALLQIGFEESIHLLDVVTLKERLKTSGKEAPDTCIWTAIRQRYFENPSILKLGFDLKSDLKMLMETVPQWKGMSQTWRHTLDLSSLRGLIVKECPDLFRGEDGLVPTTEGESGLSELLYLCTGQSLSKDEQMSDWEKRPLRESQLVYAATDAFCLITIYQRLAQLCQEKGINFEKIQERYFKGMLENGGSLAAQKKIKGAVQMILHLQTISDINQVEGRRNAGQVKLTVDTMLLGMGRYLRSIGFDTWLMENNQLYCRPEWNLQGRYCLTRGVAGYQRMVEAVDGEQERVYAVRSEMVVEQLEEICRHFGVALNVSRLFTVCFRCNANTFIKLSIPSALSFMEAAGCHLPTKKIPAEAEEERQKLVESLKTKALDDLILYVNPHEESQKLWNLLPETELRSENQGKWLYTPGEQKVELTRLQLVYPILDQVFICNGCGKCFWSSQRLEKAYMKEAQEKMKSQQNGNQQRNGN